MKLECEHINKDDLHGGSGLIDLNLFPFNEQFEINKVIFVRVPVGSSIGEHLHSDDSEVYFIIKGVGEYIDNGEYCDAKKGDLFIVRQGETHGLINTGKEDLEVVAILSK